jgi:hypothetical protein
LTERSLSAVYVLPNPAFILPALSAPKSPARGSQGLQRSRLIGFRIRAGIQPSEVFAPFRRRFTSPILSNRIVRLERQVQPVQADPELLQLSF